MVKVTDRFYINANTNNYVLQEKTTVQDEKSEKYGQEIFKDLGYYSSLNDCLKGMLKTVTREFINQEEENTVKDLLIQIKLQNEFIKKLNLNI
ncbi:MAG: hypothetical protein ACI4UX_05770 [Clostridia bacterium]